MPERLTLEQFYGATSPAPTPQESRRLSLEDVYGAETVQAASRPRPEPSPVAPRAPVARDAVSTRPAPEPVRAERVTGRIPAAPGETTTAQPYVPIPEVVTGRGEPEQPLIPSGREIGSVARAAGRGAADLPLAFPEQVAVGQERQQRAIARQWERIDRGEKPDMAQLREDLGYHDFQLPVTLTQPVMAYMRASPEQRQAIRAEVPALEERAGYRAAQAGREAVEEALPRDPQAEAARPFLHALGSGFGMTAGFAATGAVGSAFGLPALPTMAMTGMVANASGQFRDALNAGASFEDAARAAELSGLIGTTEALPIARVFDRFDSATGGTLTRAFKEALKGGTEETAQEITQTLADNLIASGVVEYDPERGAFEGTGEAAGVGFTVGGLFSFVASALGSRVRGPRLEERAPPAREETEPLAPERGRVEEPPRQEPPIAREQAERELRRFAEAAGEGPSISAEAAARAQGRLRGFARAASGERLSVADVYGEAGARFEEPMTATIDREAERAPPEGATNAARSAETEGVGNLDTSVLGDVTSQILDNTAYKDAHAESFRLALRPDEIAALREVGVEVSDQGVLSRENAERLLSERDQRTRKRSAIDREAAQAEQPTEAQAESGNYRKGHVRLHGMDISIETPRGQPRGGYETPLPAHYGYVRGTEGKDGDQVDVFVGPDPESNQVFVVDQIDPETGRFDEHKAVLGARSREEAEELYRGSYDDRAEGRFGAITEMPVGEFKAWLDRPGRRRGALAYRRPEAPARAISAPSAAEAVPARGEAPARGEVPEEAVARPGAVESRGTAITSTYRGPAERPTPVARSTASWAIRDKATGEVVMETFDRRRVDALNTEKYEAVPIQEHLAGLNRREAAPLAESEQAIPETAAELPDRLRPGQEYAGGRIRVGKEQLTTRKRTKFSKKEIDVRQEWPAPNYTITAYGTYDSRPKAKDRKWAVRRGDEVIAKATLTRDEALDLVRRDIAQQREQPAAEQPRAAEPTTETTPEGERDQRPSGEIEFYSGLPFGKLWDWFLGPFFARYYETMGHLPGGKATYMRPRRMAQGRIDEGDRVARQIFDELVKVPPEDLSAIFEYLTTRDAPLTKIPKASRAVARQAKQIMNLMSRELLWRGAITQQQYDAYKDSYLPQLYLKFVLDEGFLSTGGGRPIVGRSMMGRLKKRKLTPDAAEKFEKGAVDLDFMNESERAVVDRYHPDVQAQIRDYLTTPRAKVTDIKPHPSIAGRTQAVRNDIQGLKGRILLRFHQEIMLGQIKDPAYLVARATGEALRSIAIWDFLEFIANKPEWIYPNSLVDWRGRKVTVRWLKAEAERLRGDRHHYPTPESRERVRLIAEEMEDLANATMPESEAPDLYRQVPDSKRYGYMRGLWVRTEIYNDIVGSISPQIPDKTWQHIFENARKVNSAWKGFRTAWRLAGQARNALSGYVAANVWGEVPFVRMPDMLLRTIHDMASDGRGWKIARRHGVRATSFAHSELLKIHDEFRRRLTDDPKLRGHPLLFARELFVRLNDTFGDLYSLNEQLWKTLVIKYHTERGMPEQEAVDLAYDALFDYSDVTQFVRLMRSMPLPFASPFLTFTYKAFPMTIKSMLKRPWAYMPWVGMVYASWGMLQAVWELDDDEAEQLWQNTQEWLKSAGGSMTLWLPGKDEHGRWQPVDLSYILPWGGIWSMAHAARESEWWEVAQGVGVLSHPMYSIPAAIQKNEDHFGRPIYTEGAPPQQKVFEGLSYLLTQLLPLDNFTMASRVIEATEGRPTRWGEPGLTPGQAGARLGGVNIYPLDPEIERRKGLFRRVGEIREAEEVLRNIYRDQSLTEAEQKKRAARQLEYMEKLERELGEFLERSTIPAKIEAKPQEENEQLGLDRGDREDRGEQQQSQNRALRRDLADAVRSGDERRLATLAAQASQADKVAAARQAGSPALAAILRDMPVAGVA